MKNKGVALVWLSVLITLNLFVISKWNLNSEVTLSWITISQVISLVGTVLLCLSFVLSSRFRWLENLFGGLDKVYKIHHFTGGLGFVLLIHHPLFLAINVLPRTDLTLKYFWFSNLISYNYGIFALYIMLLLLVLTLIINLPYNLWLKTHEFMGVVLIFASLHILTIVSDVSRYSPLRFWIVLWLVLALVAVIYKRFLYNLIGPRYRYVIESNRVIGDIVEIWLKPITKQMNYYAGQFVFANFESLGKEVHPFSISSNGFDGRVRLDIKILGDYTLKTKSLKQGEIATLYGPYGKFYESLLGKSDLVWIAGGIGITPFMGMLDLAKRWNKQKVELIYCAKTESEMIFDEEIRNKIRECDNFSYCPHCSNNKGRITAKSILEIVGNFNNKKFLLCGPVEMMTSLSEQLAELGVKRKNIIFEDFNFK